MNHTLIAGHLGADPEVRFTSTGLKVTILRVACNNRRGNKEETIWWKATIWGETFDKMLPYLKKGSPIMVFGELSKPEIYTDKEGRPQVSLNLTVSNLQFSPFGRSQQDSREQKPSDMLSQSHMNKSEASSSNSKTFEPADMMQGQAAAEEFDDEIPF